MVARAIAEMLFSNINVFDFCRLLFMMFKLIYLCALAPIILLLRPANMELRRIVNT